MPDLDELLRDDGAAWRADVDARRPVIAAEAISSTRGRRGRVSHWPAPLAAALITLLIAGGISYLASRATHSRTQQPALPLLPTAGTSIDPLTPAPAAQIADAAQRARPVRITHAKPGGVNLSMPWHFLALLDQGRTILVNYTLGDPCDRPLGFRVQQGRNAVELTALSQAHRGQCEQPLLGAFGTIHLDRPLGKRLLLHAPPKRH